MDTDTDNYTSTGWKSAPKFVVLGFMKHEICYNQKTMSYWLRFLRNNDDNNLSDDWRRADRHFLPA